MPVDGTYGRLSAHNQRFKELRRKKTERREKTIKRYSLKGSRKPIATKTNSKNIDPVHLKRIKTKIRAQANQKTKKEGLVILVLLLTSIVVYFLLVYKS